MLPPPCWQRRRRRWGRRGVQKAGFQLHGTAQYCTPERQACGVINTDLLPPLPSSGLARHSQQRRGLPRPCTSLLFIAGDCSAASQLPPHPLVYFLSAEKIVHHTPAASPAPCPPAFPPLGGHRRQQPSVLLLALRRACRTQQRLNHEVNIWKAAALLLRSTKDPTSPSWLGAHQRCPLEPCAPIRSKLSRSLSATLVGSFS